MCEKEQEFRVGGGGEEGCGGERVRAGMERTGVCVCICMCRLCVVMSIKEGCRLVAWRWSRREDID